MVGGLVGDVGGSGLLGALVGGKLDASRSRRSHISSFSSCLSIDDKRRFDGSSMVDSLVSDVWTTREAGMVERGVSLYSSINELRLTLAPSLNSTIKKIREIDKALKLKRIFVIDDKQLWCFMSY